MFTCLLGWVFITQISKCNVALQIFVFSMRTFLHSRSNRWDPKYDYPILKRQTCQYVEPELQKDEMLGENLHTAVYMNPSNNFVLSPQSSATNSGYHYDEPDIGISMNKSLENCGYTSMDWTKP